MHKNAHPLEKLNFGELQRSTEKEQLPTWAEKSSTLYAHPSGKLPSRFAAAGWQPVFSPSERKPISATISGIIRRVRKSRGEA